MAKANKRLSKLKSSELDPCESELANEDLHEFDLNGKLSMSTGLDELVNRKMRDGRSSSLDTASLHSEGCGSGEESDQSYDKVVMPTPTILRGGTISDIRRRTVDIKFDIMDTRIVGGRSKYVLYVLVVTVRGSEIDVDRAVIERRYSHFYKLYKELKKMFPTFLRSIEFPEKKLYGNLESSLIRTRCQLLQEFVQKIYDNQEVRNSETFKKFFYLSSLQQGCQYICGGQFEEALTFLLNGLHLQQKLALDSSKEVVATLCNIVECYMSLEKYEEVIHYGKAALEILEGSFSNVHLLPLLQTLNDAYSILGKNTDEVEQRIKREIELNQIEVEHVASLRELAVKRFVKK